MFWKKRCTAVSTACQVWLRNLLLYMLSCQAQVVNTSIIQCNPLAASLHVSILWHTNAINSACSPKQAPTCGNCLLTSARVCLAFCRNCSFSSTSSSCSLTLHVHRSKQSVGTVPKHCPQLLYRVQLSCSFLQAGIEPKMATCQLSAVPSH